VPISLVPVANIEERVNRTFASLESSILSLLPRARVEHIGATAIPGSLTKGDVDVLVLVSAPAFSDAEATLAAKFARNRNSEVTGLFASFEGVLEKIDFGIQLTTPENTNYNFLQWRDSLLASPDLLAQYNALKQANCHGSMDEYRQAKAEFIEQSVSTAT
jgi:GrpB-like predicted nucleotidyltransferase (UPF0157 family)